MHGALDFETWEWVNPLCCGFAWGPPFMRQTYFLEDTSKGYKRSKDIAKAALAFMWETPEVDTWWAHNGGKFDCLFLVEAAIALGWRVRGHVAAGRAITVFFQPHHEEKRWVKLNDSYAVCPASLKSSAADFELPSRKLFTEDDYSVDTRKWNKQRLKDGCLTDCILVLELLEKLETLVEGWGGELRATFSSSALTCVKAKLAEDGLKLPSHKGIESVQDTLHNAYYGARVEIFEHMPNYTLQEYDVCSSYPWAMSQPVPWECLGYGKNRKTARRILNGDRNSEGVIYARVTVPKQPLPPLPYRDQTSGGIYFPTGTWEAWFPACELRYALSLAQGQAPHVEALDAVAYTQANPFNRFINEIYQLKATAKGAVRNFSKLMLNGCYGKFGQHPEQEDIRVFHDSEDKMTFVCKQPPGTVTDMDSDGRIVSVKRYSWPKHTHYGIASYITARARTLLHDYLLNSDRPAYCDSDSVHAAKYTGEIGNALGQLKLELADYRGTFYAPKIYKLVAKDKTHLAAKGFPVEESAFELLVKGEQVERDRMQLLKSQLRKEGKASRIEKELKQWRGRSSKRKPYTDGSTRAWTVDEIIKGEHLTAKSPV